MRRSTAGKGPTIDEAVLDRPLSAEEMAAIRRALRDEGRLGRDLMALIGKVARRVPFAADALSAWYCARDPRTSLKVKGVLLAALAYFVLPVDVIPDLIPFLGFTDDAAVIGAALAAVAGAITDDHRDQARETLERL